MSTLYLSTTASCRSSLDFLFSVLFSLLSSSLSLDYLFYNISISYSLLLWLRWLNQLPRFFVSKLRFKSRQVFGNNFLSKIIIIFSFPDKFQFVFRNKFQIPEHFNSSYDMSLFHWEILRFYENAYTVPVSSSDSSRITYNIRVD